MISKLDGAGVVHADKSLRPEAERAPVPTSISWSQTTHDRSAALRHGRISVAAYYLAEARGFVSGHEAADWLQAQAQVDAMDAGIYGH